MDAISDRAFGESSASTAANIHRVVDETPSLLTVILDLHPLAWKSCRETNDKIDFRNVTASMLVMMNSHLALNSGNRVSLFIANSFSQGVKRVYPEETSLKDTILEKDGSLLKSVGIYGQFKVLDENILDTLDKLFHNEPERLRDIINKDDVFVKGTITGAISRALSAINKLQKHEETLNMKARVLVISVSGDNTIPYVSMMNTIFAAQKMKISIDVCKLGEKSIFLQQTADATNGVYMDIKYPNGLIQYLSNAFFIEPLLRPMIVLPSNTSVDFRASCFVTNKVVDIGYVCSVCLCILSVIPGDERCPTCHSPFEHSLVTKLKRKPKVLPLDVKRMKK